MIPKSDETEGYAGGAGMPGPGPGVSGICQEDKQAVKQDRIVPL